VLLIVCASVANLALARTMRRDRELALHRRSARATGALLRQLVTESLILSSRAAGDCCSPSSAWIRSSARRALHSTGERSRHQHDGAALHPRGPP
jgi:hypothetical protein